MVAVKKPKPQNDTATLQSDVASFASSLGLLSSGGAAAPSSGFNDSDFRKTGPIKPQSQSLPNPQRKSSTKNPKIENRKPNPRRNTKPADNQKHDSRISNLLPENDNSKFKNLPKLPLVKASALGVWYNDAAELEEKLIGKDKKIEVNSAEEWKVLVEKKKELGERLLAQYAQDYLSSRGQHGDIKMLVATQRSGTAADKVSALSVMIGDNAVANLRSVDLLLGNAVVIDEVDNFLFRPHLGLRAKYHAVNFLSQIRLSHKGDGPKAAKRLIDIYFALFKVLISEAGASSSASKHEKKVSSSLKEGKIKATSESHVEMDSRLLSALLTGVNRAFPFVSSDEADDVVEVQTPLLFKVVHSKNFNVGVQALMLLDKISSKNQIVSDRFYRALYSKLLLPAAMNSSKEEMFIALILRAMKNDINIKRVAAFSKRLLQVALQLPPQYACACLFMLSEVLKARPPLWNMVLQNEAVDADDDLEHFEDITENDENQAIPAPDNRGTKGLIADSSNVSDDDGDSSLDERGSATSGSEGDIFNEEDDLLGEGGLDKLEEFKSNSNHEVHNLQGPSLPGGYNPRHREPSYCNADRVGWWELMVLASHVHPSVAAMAGTLLSGVNILYNGNPLSDLSLGAFLDKFMEKKPRQNIWHGASQIEPAKKVDMNHQLIGAEILSLAEADVPPEDVVFHKFYMNKMNSSKKPKKKKKKTPEDEAAEELYAVDGDEDGSEDEEIDNMMDSVNPSSIEADGDYDYDDLDKIANEDDEDLIGDASDDDDEIDVPSDVDNDEIEDDVEASSRENSDADDDDDDVAIGEADDGSDIDDGSFVQRKKKRKSKGVSPFASLEEYEHLMEDEVPEKDSPTKKKGHKHKSKKKRKISKSE
ncbi:hypothetical protein DH2020_041547 [Rehmannia glutinosa]|uniref:CCAAT-binding factor domain-containing protein n=1 Tax=Rehmannia glutinosa TaxID=99300 RepID=A0ABR0UR58_REHGL